MTHAKSNWETSLDRKLRKRFSVSLMNNTKWRELWIIIAQLKLRVQVAYVSDSDWNTEALWGPFSADLIIGNGLRDPGINGPVLFKELLWVRIPKGGMNDASAFVEQCRLLGQLPISETDEYVEVRGYK